MSSSLVLSRAQIAELARSPRKVAQLSFLRRNGIRHYLDANGWPVVLRSALEATEFTSAAKPTWKPNKVA